MTIINSYLIYNYLHSLPSIKQNYPNFPMLSLEPKCKEKTNESR